MLALLAFVGFLILPALSQYRTDAIDRVRFSASPPSESQPQCPTPDHNAQATTLLALSFDHHASVARHLLLLIRADGSDYAAGT